MECSLFNNNKDLCLIATPSSGNLGCGWCNNICVELKCEWGFLSGYDSKCNDGELLSTSSNGKHICAGKMTLISAIGCILIILFIILILTTLTFNCKCMKNIINKACNPKLNYRKKFSHILSVFHYIVALIFGTVTCLYSFISLQSEINSSVVIWPYLVLLIVWCDIGGLLDLIPYWILPYNKIDKTGNVSQLQTKRNRSVLFKFIVLIAYLLIYFIIVYCAMFCDEYKWNGYQSTLLMSAILWCLFLYVYLPLPTTYSFWITQLLQTSANIKILLKAQKKYLKKLRKEKLKNQSQIDMSVTEITANNSRVISPNFRGQKGNEFAFSPSTMNRPLRSNSDPSSETNRKWSFSNNNHGHNDLLYFQLSAADMNQRGYKYTGKTTYSTTDNYNNINEHKNQNKSSTSNINQVKFIREKNINKNKENMIDIYKSRANRVGLRVGNIYRHRNSANAANIRIDIYRRGFYLFLWILGFGLNILSYFDYKHSMFWDAVLIMFIYIVFKRFDHLLIAIINPFYRKCCRKYRIKKQITISDCNKLETEYKQLKNDKNDIELDIKVNKNNKNELKEPLMASRDGYNAKINENNNNNTIIPPSIDMMLRKREIKQDEYESDSDTQSDSSDSIGIYGPGSLAEGRVDEGYIGDRIFGVQMDFVSFIPSGMPINTNVDFNTLGNLGTIYQSQPL
eukprot:42097_1